MLHINNTHQRITSAPDLRGIAFSCARFDLDTYTGAAGALDPKLSV
jgi:hypothetical protein